MTVEEKAGVLRTYCASRIGCAGCPLALDSIHHKHTCYSFWYKFPEDIERNYDLIFGNDTNSDEEKDEDMVNHPSHYTSGGVECIDAITAALSKYDDPVDSWLVGQVIKYLWRAPLKGKYDEDIKKAQFYLNRLVEKIDKNG